ncbi:TraB/GumN family protein [Sphingomonas sp. AOB5]|uniref:TraB/GumN family protein n=1 Tax=Sphingomonas sp. AOB5 TaxID=3034017 RepID=UPI0023F72D57|nr:TraB/GumN family protein [Sphingomonas sp. AOB5]MDF7777004.1 TraB/GumN family protein [Sphingomonas sp. AOB5]
MMLKKLFLSGAVLATAFALTVPATPVLAQSAPAQAAPAAATTPADPALWVLKDEDTTIYLFGTVHALKPGLSWFDGAVRDAFDKSDQVMLEMVEPEPAALQAIVMPMALNATGPTITEQLPADKRAAYSAAMDSVGAPAAMFDRFDPWFASIVLTAGSLPKLGYDPNQGVEKVLTAAAKEAGKPVGGLETAEQQLGYFDTMPQPLQIAFLISTVDEMPKMGTMLDQMVAHWAKGDPEGLGALMNQSMSMSPEITRILLTDRNGRWADWIAKRMEQPGTVFIAVGAGHLAGGNSVQAFLAKKNLKVVRVQY